MSRAVSGKGGRKKANRPDSLKKAKKKSIAGHKNINMRNTIKKKKNAAENKNARMNDTLKKAKPKKAAQEKIKGNSDDLKKILEEIKHTVNNRKPAKKTQGIGLKTILERNSHETLAHPALNGEARMSFKPFQGSLRAKARSRTIESVIESPDKAKIQPTAHIQPIHSENDSLPKTKEKQPDSPEEKISLQKKEMESFKLNTCSIDTYLIGADGVPAEVYIFSPQNEYVPIYRLIYPKIPLATHSILNSIREELITLVTLSTKEFVDPTAIINVKQKFSIKAHELIKKYLPGIAENDENILVGYLIHEMLGLGVIELLIADDRLEEIVINNSKDPIWVYHKKHGWLKTTVILENEEMIYNYSSSIGRRVGRQITNLYPLMDAHLHTGDRVNATLFPISTVGNTITIRKFARSPWTIIHFLDPKVRTISTEAVALIWLAIQYELNILVVGGTASGKTSFLNTLMPFIPPNQRVISIEDTREINLPKFLQWIPFSSREPNPEGKGGVSMLDLLMNALRMRPDRIIVGEIRREKEVEVMFEAIRTGHSAYATFHADSAHQAYQRIINPPISLPASMLSALHLMVVQYRHRRLGIRRTLELGEIVPTSATENKLNILYRWNPKSDVLENANKTFRIFNEITMYTGMNEVEIEENLKNREIILSWMVRHGIKTVNSVGKVIAEYYKNEGAVINAAKKDAKPEEIIGCELMDEVRKAAGDNK